MSPLCFMILLPWTQLIYNDLSASSLFSVIHSTHSHSHAQDSRIPSGRQTSLDVLCSSKIQPHFSACSDLLSVAQALSKSESWLVSHHLVSFQMLQVHFCSSIKMNFPISLCANHHHSSKDGSSIASFLGPLQIVLPSFQSPHFTDVYA